MSGQPSSSRADAGRPCAASPRCRWPRAWCAPGIVVDGEALTEALRTLWATGKFGSKEVRLGVANSGVMVRQMVLDWMPPADFKQALRYQVQDALPMPVDDANLDYHLLEELELANEGEDPRRVARILLVAAAREVVDPFVEAARNAGLRTSGVDLLPFALVRARTPGGLDPAGETEAIVDIGADVVSVVVHTGGVPRYVRIIPGVGGDSITQAVQNGYQWSWEDAERTKVFVGLPGHANLDESQRKTVTSRADGLEHPAQKLVVSAATTLVTEISTTLDFYRASAADGSGAAGRRGPGAALRRRCPAGWARRAARGAARHPGGPARRDAPRQGLAQLAALPGGRGCPRCRGRAVRRSRPMKRRGGGGHPRPALPTVNLLSQSEFDRMAVRRLRKRFVAGGIAMLVLVGAGWFVQHTRVNDAQKLVTVEQAQTNRLSSQAQTLTAIKVFVTGVDGPEEDGRQHAWPGRSTSPGSSRASGWPARPVPACSRSA